jgi:class 3 adenylate cyclase
MTEFHGQGEMALKFLSGAEAGRVMLVKTPMKFGRHRENSVCLSYDDRISRYHAEIRATSGEPGFELVDLGSTNGSIHAGRVLRGEGVPIKPGDTFALGSTTFLYDWSEKLLSPSLVSQGKPVTTLKTLAINAESVGKSQTEALLIADMRDSTALGEILGERRMMALKGRLFDILQRAAHRHNTQFTKNTGDGHMMTFPTLTAAIGATRAIVGEVAAHNTSEEKVHPLHLRLALTLGETTCDFSGDRHGQIVNLAFRLVSLSALPGEVPGDPMSEVTTPLIAATRLAEAIGSEPWDPAPPTPIHLPPQNIKGFPEPIPVTIFPLTPDVGTTA